MSCQVMERASLEPEKVSSGKVSMEKTGGRWTVFSIDFSGESKDLDANFGNEGRGLLCISLNFWVPSAHIWA